jgi:hypothetical protein
MLRLENSGRQYEGLVASEEGRGPGEGVSVWRGGGWRCSRFSGVRPAPSLGRPFFCMALRRPPIGRLAFPDFRLCVLGDAFARWRAHAASFLGANAPQFTLAEESSILSSESCGLFGEAKIGWGTVQLERLAGDLRWQRRAGNPGTCCDNSSA